MAPKPPSRPSGGGGTTQTKKYIGVPDDYTSYGPATPGNFNGQTYPRAWTTPPLYKPGDEYRLAPNSRDDIVQLQLAMVQAGLLSKTGFAPGSWDNATRGAYSELLGVANQSGSTWDVALGAMLQNAELFGGIGSAGGGGAMRAPLVKQLTNPDDLKAIANLVAGEVYGRGLSDEEKEAFVQTFQSLEGSVQEQAYGMAMTGGTIIGPPAADVAAEKFLKEREPAEAAATSFANQAAAFEEMVT